MAHDVEDGAVGVDDEEAPHTPGLVGQRVDDLHAAAHPFGVDGVDLHGGARVRFTGEDSSRATMLTCAVGFVGETHVTTRSRCITPVNQRN